MLHVRCARQVRRLPSASCSTMPAADHGFNRARARGVDEAWCRSRATGYFASESGQFSCINCNSVGDFYQERSGQRKCDACALNTQRYITDLSAANRSTCQCKAGAHRTSRAVSVSKP